MSSERKYILLAVVLLLEYSKSTMDGNCDARTPCYITQVAGTVATVTCESMALKKIYTFGERFFNKDSINSTFRKYPLNVNMIVKNSSDVILNDNLIIRTTNKYVDSFKTNNGLSDHNFQSNTTNSPSRDLAYKTKSSDSTVLKESVSTYINYVATRIKNKSDSKKNFRKSIHNRIWSNITTIRLILKNTSIIDLSPFPNATVVNIYGINETITYVCGVENVLELSMIMSKLKHINFIKCFVNLIHLVFTHSYVRIIPFFELPLSIAFLDISYNNINFNKNVSLPENLRILNVSSNLISHERRIHIKGKVRLIDLSKNKLNYVPNLIMFDLEELYLSHNKISAINIKDLTNLFSLTVLDLKKNCINNLEENVFEGLYKLQRIDLSQNQIKFLPPSSFQYLDSLLTLKISENTNLGNLQELKDNSFLFGTGQRLQIIDASKTNMTRMPSTLTRSVRKLFLRDNMIRTIRCGELDSFPLLQTMDLSTNLLTEVEEDALGRLEFLSKLFLSDNKITSIPKSLPSQLQVLDLSLNLIDNLQSNYLLGLQKLKALFLSKNKIATIEDEAFGQLISLEVLDLSYNPIKVISRNSFLGPRQLKEIYLVSLTELIFLEKPLLFPELGHLKILNMESSPVLARQLLDNTSVLTMFHELFKLNLNHCRLSTLRSDLPEHLPSLHTLELSGNRLNCSNIIWLARWLKTLNNSIQSNVRYRKEIYNMKEMYCDKEIEIRDKNDVMCFSPEYLAGRQIISLNEKDFHDLKVTSSAVLPSQDVNFTKSYQSRTFVYSSFFTDSFISHITKNTLWQLPSPATTKPNLLDVKNTLGPISKRKSYEVNVVPSNEEEEINSYNNLTKRIISKNRNRSYWKYSKYHQKIYSDYFLTPPNKTKNTLRNIGNRLNDTIGSKAFLVHGTTQDSHPGMVLFLVLVFVMLGVTSVILYSQCSKIQNVQKEYKNNHEMELFNLGGHDLW